MTVCDEKTVGEARTSLWRSRWAAIGAAVAVSVGAGGMFVAQAAPGTAESTIVSVTPERILDTRNGNDIGLPGPFVSAVAQKLQVTGSIPTATGTKTVVPAGATGVLLNVTPVGPTTAGFISIRPGDATGAASTSSLNFTAGAISPNSVQVAMPTSGANAGKIDITFDAYGVAGPTTDILIDVVGYTTNTGLQELVADVYTKAQADSRFVPQGEIVLSHGTNQLTPNASSVPTTVSSFIGGMRVSGDGIVGLGLDGPARLGGVDYGLKSIEYCVEETTSSPSFVTSVQVTSQPLSGGGVADGTDRTNNGCYTVLLNLSGAQAYEISWNLAGGGTLRFSGVKSTWAPSNTLAQALSIDPVPLDGSAGL